MQPSSRGNTRRCLQQQQQMPQAALHALDRLRTACSPLPLTSGHTYGRLHIAGAATRTFGVTLNCSTAVLQQHMRQHNSTMQQLSSRVGPWQTEHTTQGWEQCRCRTLRIRCSSSAADDQPLPDALLQQQQQQGQGQQQEQQLPQQRMQQQGDTITGVPGSSQQHPTAMPPHLMHMQPPPQPVSVPSLLAWLPPSLLLRARRLANFVAACWGLLREFHAPPLAEAMRRLVLVLGASLALIVVVSTIDSGWLYLYLLNARRVPVAA